MSSVVFDPQNQFEIVLEIPLSCDAAGREMYFVRCFVLKRTGTFASEEQDYVFIYLF